MDIIYKFMAVLVTIIPLVEGDDCGTFITDTTVNNVRYKGWYKHDTNLTVTGCTRLCQDDRQSCRSYAFHTRTGECFLYGRFGSVGEETESSEGLVFFWSYSQPCPASYTYLNESRSCVKIYRQEKVWNAAHATCSQDGGHLIILNKGEKRQFLIDNYDQSTIDHFHWVGATDQQDEGSWRWADGSKINRYWMEGEPNDREGEDCLELRHDPDTDYRPFFSQLNDAGCEDAKRFACEIPQSLI